MNDFELLREYAERGSEDAFTALVKRYVDLVFSAARRQARDARNAEEISQAVFLVLARKAQRLPRETVLCGWLLRTTRFVALNVRRREWHRLKTDQEMMNLPPTETESTWGQIAPILDEALLTLNDKDRDAVTLRYFEDKSFKEIGQRMGTSADVAQKRVSRAVEKLRSNFARRGVALPAALITGALAVSAVQAAPGALAESIRVGALSAAAGPAVALAEITVAAWRAARVKILVLQGLAVTAAAVVFFLAVQSHIGRGDPVVQAARQQVLPATAVKETSAAPATGPVATEETNASGLEFHVMDAATHAPVSQVRLTLDWAAGLPYRLTNIMTTDKEGTALLKLPRVSGQNWDYRIEVYRDGYVPKYVSWSAAQGDNSSEIPVLYTTEMARAASIGGVVQDESGEPVAGARVVFNVYPKNVTVERERPTMGQRYHVEIADREGRWHCNHVPVQFGAITFGVNDVTHAPRTYGVATLGGTTNQGTGYLAEEDLRKGTAVMTMVPGAVAGGVVVDDSGLPVAGARVTFNQSYSEPTANVSTDANGRFRFANMEPATKSELNNICFFTVEAEGFAPTDLQLPGRVPPEESRITLAHGALLRGTVADENGTPIASASIQICSHSNQRRFEWGTVTDEAGKFSWASAPPGPEFYIVDAPGYEPIPEIEWTADGSEHQVTLHTIAPRKISGAVVDAESGNPVDNFEVWMSSMEKAQTGYDAPMSRARPLQRRAVGRAGEFSFTNRSSILNYTLEIRAEGYVPAAKLGKGPMTEDASFSFQIKHGLTLTGTAQLPDGKPVAGAVAILCTEEPRHIPWQPAGRSGAYIKLPGQFDLTIYGTGHQETDSQGRFSFPPKANTTKIIVASPAGFGSVKVEEFALTHRVTLQPWGRVAGVLKIGSQLGTNQNIELNYSDMIGEWTGYSLFLESSTDANGEFVFEGVPPGPLEISHRLNFRDNQMGAIPLSQQMRIWVQSGQTTRVTVGGTGRKVVGKIKLDGSDRQLDWQADVQWLNGKTGGAPTPPGRRDFASAQEYAEAGREYAERQQAFWASEAGLEVLRHRRRYVLEFANDGSFKIEDVVPGTYNLQIRITDPKAPMRGMPAGMYNSVATLNKEVVVPESAGDSAGPYDLGELVVKEQNGQ